ncbi:MAG: AsmA family protein [Gammaproteobacteria bacterium]|nr:AsmA family protein [Gammaproteobacteria bacterium]
MRPLKLLAWIVGGLAGLVVIALIAVLLIVDPNDYKEEIAEAVRDRTGRDLKLEGELRLSVFPWLAIETGRAELGNAAGFGPGPFLTLERADVGVRLFPLLRGDMQVRRLELDGLKVSLVKDADGKSNWADLAESDPQAPAGEPAPTKDAPKMPTIAGISIENSSIDYQDLEMASRWRVEKLDLSTGRVASGEPIGVQMEFDLDQGEGTPSRHVRLKTEATLNIEAERYALAELELDAVLPPDAAAKAEGAKDMEVSLRAPTAVADLQAQTLSLPEFTAKAVGAQITGSLEGKQIVDAPAITGSITLEPVSPRELLAQLGSKAPATRDADALKTLSFQGKLNATDHSAMIEDLKLTLDDTSATGSAGIADFDKTALRFDLVVDRIDVDRYLAPEAQAQAGGEAKAEPFELPMDLLRELDAQGRIRIGQLTLSGIKMSDVLFSVDAGDGLVKLNPTQAKLYGGTHRGAFAIDARGGTARVTVDETLTAIDFAPLFADLMESQRLAGKGNARAVLSGSGNDSDKIMRTLDGRIEFNVQDGAIKGADLWYELRRARALWERQAAPAEPSTGQTRFNTLQGTAQVTDGVLENRDLNIDMDYVKVNGEGTYALPTQKVDYRLTANVYKVPREGAGTEMASLQATQIPVRVSGTMADLKIRPDVEGLAKSRAKEKLEEKKEELTEKLGEKLGDLFGRKKKKPEPGQ